MIHSKIAMAQQRNEQAALREANIQLALQAMQRDATLTQQQAAKIYKVSQKYTKHMTCWDSFLTRLRNQLNEAV